MIQTVDSANQRIQKEGRGEENGCREYYRVDKVAAGRVNRRRRSSTSLSEVNRRRRSSTSLSEDIKQLSSLNRRLSAISKGDPEQNIPSRRGSLEKTGSKDRKKRKGFTSKLSTNRKVANEFVRKLDLDFLRKFERDKSLHSDVSLDNTETIQSCDITVKAGNNSTPRSSLVGSSRTSGKDTFEHQQTNSRARIRAIPARRSLILSRRASSDGVSEVDANKSNHEDNQVKWKLDSGPKYQPKMPTEDSKNFDQDAKNVDRKLDNDNVVGTQLELPIDFDVGAADKKSNVVGDDLLMDIISSFSASVNSVKCDSTTVESSSEAEGTDISVLLSQLTDRVLDLKRVQEKEREITDDMLCKLLKEYDNRSRKLSESSRVISRLITPKLEKLAKHKSKVDNCVFASGKESKKVHRRKSLTARLA